MKAGKRQGNKGQVAQGGNKEDGGLKNSTY